MVSSRLFSLGLPAAALLSLAAAQPALAQTPFNGTFDTSVTQSGFGATGTGTSANSPLGLVSENFSYSLTSFPINNIATFTGTDIFSNADGSSTLFADVSGTINISDYTGQGVDTFSPTASTGIFAGDTGTATLTATVLNQANKTIQDQYSGTIIAPAAVPEASSTVSLGLLLGLGLLGLGIQARRKSPPTL